MEKEIGLIIKFHRKKAKLTQIELAELAELGKTVIYDIENGKETVRLSTLIKVFKVLNLNLKIEGPFIKEFLEKRGNEKS